MSGFRIEEHTDLISDKTGMSLAEDRRGGKLLSGENSKGGALSNNPRMKIVFDFGGYYLKKGKENKWISSQIHQFLRLERSYEHVTYSYLVNKLCLKAKVDEARTKLKLSYVADPVDRTIPLYIFDDDDVVSFLEMNEEKFYVLHVEVVKDKEHEREEDRGSLFVGSNDEVNKSGTCSDENTSEDENTTQFEGEASKNSNVRATMVISNEERENIDNYETFEGEATPTVNVEWEDGLNLKIRQEFPSKNAVKDIVEAAAHKNCFEFDIVKSDKVLFVVKCCERKKGCKWFLRAAKDMPSDTFSVRTYQKMHTCSRSTTSTMRQKRRGTARLVASVLREDYPCSIETPAPKHLIPLVQSRLGVKVAYSTANRGKKLAAADVRGTPEDSYRNVYSYLHMLEKKNPGTVSYVELDEKKRFKYLFFALGPCIEGFQAMRKVIIVDGTCITNKFGGVLIVATGQDPDHHHYPVAFGVVDREKDASWTWFFEKLKTVVPDSPELVFCSDRHQSLIKSVSAVYPLSHHGYCIYYLSQNVKLSCKNVNRDLVAKTFMECSRAYTEPEFLNLFAAFVKKYPNAGAYLKNSVGQEKWARCYFPGSRYNIDTINNVESINGVFVQARTYALLPMIDAIIEKVTEWWNKHRKMSVETPEGQKLVPYVEKLMHTRCTKAKLLPVTEINLYFLEYKVTAIDGSSYVVDLKNKTCDCKCFDIDKYPCVHAIAAAMAAKNSTGTEFPLHEFCSKYYWMEQWTLAYAKSIYPVPSTDMWMVPQDVCDLIVHPKAYVKKKGRKRTRRFPSTGEQGRRKSRSSSVPQSSSVPESSSVQQPENFADRWFNCGV